MTKSLYIKKVLATGRLNPAANVLSKLGQQRCCYFLALLEVAILVSIFSP